MTASRVLLALLAGCLLAVPGPWTGMLGRARAADLCSGPGVNVVVDFGALGGGVREACDPTGAQQPAAAALQAAGFALSYVQREPGFVCQVAGRPATSCVNTPPADAYWGLFWSNGRSGRWRYAPLAAGSLVLPDGGTVGFAWQGSRTQVPPRVAPPTGAGPVTGSGTGSGTGRSTTPGTSATAGAAATRGGLPVWVPVGLVAVLVAGSGVLLARRRGAGG